MRKFWISTGLLLLMPAVTGYSVVQLPMAPQRHSQEALMPRPLSFTHSSFSKAAFFSALLVTSFQTSDTLLLDLTPGRFESAKLIEAQKLSRILPRLPFVFSKTIPEVSHLEEFLRLPVAAHQPFAAARYPGKPIYILKFINDAAMGLAFDRIWIFVEIQPGLVPSESETRAIGEQDENTGGGGQDYRLSSLAEFFTEAAHVKIPLNVVEQRLLDELLRFQLLVQEQEGFAAPEEGALISVSGEEADDTAAATLRHEYIHAAFYTEPEYREAALQVWRSMPEQDQKFAQAVMEAFIGYPFAEEDHIVKEFLSYFDQPQGIWDWYLEPMEEDILQAEADSPLAVLKPYFSSDARKKELRDRLVSLSWRVKSIESRSHILPTLEHKVWGLSEFMLPKRIREFALRNSA